MELNTHLDKHPLTDPVNYIGAASVLVPVVDLTTNLGLLTGTRGIWVLLGVGVASLVTNNIKAGKAARQR